MVGGREKGASARGQWANQLEFLLSCIGYAVGLGNVWRFPYLCYKNGGGAFLIPYVISLFVAGLPIFYLELTLGQFSALGPNCIFGKLAPVMQGIGWGMVVVSILVSIYYNMIIAWCLFYFVASFRSVLQWSSCRLGYGYTARCFSDLDENYCREHLGDTNATFFNLTCWSGANATAMNVTGLRSQMSLATPAEEYFENYVLNLSSGFEEMGGVQWRLALALLGAWLLVFACLVKGVASSGKVVYFTATFPYLVLVVLLIRGCTLDGAARGIHFYMNANFTKLQELTVWKDAAVQIFYSLGPAFGGLLTMSSYNRFQNNAWRDALVVTFTNCATSIFAGFAIFSVTGFMANTLHKEVSEVVSDGSGLAFIAYPEAIVRMPGAPFWSLLFFFMLLTLGLDSQFAMVETVTTAIVDQFTELRRRKTLVVAAVCAVMYVLGLPLCTSGGMYLFTLINDYSAGYCLVLLALAEASTVVYLYGVRRFLKDVEMMMPPRAGLFWRLFGPSGLYWHASWLVLTPLFLLTILVFSFVYYGSSSYGDYVFGPAISGVGWLISVASIVMIPAFAVAALVRNLREGGKLSELIRVTPDWCPAHVREARKAPDVQLRESKESKEPGRDNPALAASDASLDKPAKY